MQSNRIVNASKIVSYVVQTLKTNVTKRLLDFCKNRVIETGLTTKGLSTEFVISQDHRETVKTISKLKTLIYKYLIKRIPYLSFTQGEFLQITDRDKFTVNIQNSEMTSDFDFIDWDLINGKIKPSNYDLTGIAERVLRLCAKEHPINKPIIRYVRYLNYIFRKYCIPVCATANFQIKFNEDVVYKLHNKKASEKKVAVIPFKIHATINFQFVKWGSHDESRHTDIRNGIMQESNFYSNASDWNIHAYGYSTSNAQGSNLYRYSIEKFFMHIDKAITIATTLSRKVNYEVTAYHFRSSEDS